MKEFTDLVQTIWPILLFGWIYSIMRYGPKNRAKYKRWDRIGKQNKKKKPRKKQKSRSRSRKSA